MNWPKVAADLTALVPWDSLLPEVREALRESGEPLHVACSGGADSVFVLLLVFGYGNEGLIERDLVCLHFDHRLRGAESIADAAFVETLCGDLGVDFRKGHADWTIAASEVTEEMARTERIRFFDAATQGRVDVADIVTGHNADDIAETMLMRLSRGSGLQGLIAPRPLSLATPRIRFLRPILGVSRREIRAELSRLFVTWREDATNAESAFYRNRLRNAVIPEWERASDRPVSAGVERSRMLLQEDWEALEAWREQLWDSLFLGEGALDAASLSDLPRAMVRRLLHQLCSKTGAPGMAASAMERAIAALVGREEVTLDLGSAWRFVADRSSAQLELLVDPHQAEWAEFQLPIGCSACLPDGSRVTAEVVSVDVELYSDLCGGERDDSRSVVVSVGEKLCSSVTVRRRRSGDAFKPHGKSSPKKLKELFIERKVPVELRDRLPIFCLGVEEIVWVPGLPPAASRLLEGPTTAALRLTYEI